MKLGKRNGNAKGLFCRTDKVSLCDVIYSLMLKWDRRKRTICHGQDTIDFGYKGLRDTPLEYEIYPIIQHILHEGMLGHRFLIGSEFCTFRP